MRIYSVIIFAVCLSVKHWRIFEFWKEKFEFLICYHKWSAEFYCKDSSNQRAYSMINLTVCIALDFRREHFYFLGCYYKYIVFLCMFPISLYIIKYTYFVYWTSKHNGFIIFHYISFFFISPDNLLHNTLCRYLYTYSSLLYDIIILFTWFILIWICASA